MQWLQFSWSWILCDRASIFFAAAVTAGILAQFSFLSVRRITDAIVDGRFAQHSLPGIIGAVLVTIFGCGMVVAAFIFSIAAGYLLLYGIMSR
jgi:hypothetical protein